MAIRQKGTKFQVDVTVNGVRAPRVSCDTQQEARKIEADFKAKLMAGVPVDMLAPAATAKAPVKDTLGDLFDAAYSAFWRGKKSEVTSLRNGEAWCKALGYDYPVAQLTSDKIGGVCDDWAMGGNSSGTINRKLSALSQMLGLALERGLIPRALRLPKRKEYAGRLRYYTDDEMESMLAFLEDDPELRALFVLAVETGMRQGELLGLTKRDVDLKGRIIMLGETKADKRRSQPLTKRAAEAATMLVQDKRDHEPLFRSTIKNSHILRRLRAWKRKHGLPAADKANFHTLRHTTCSRLVQRGVPLAVVQKFMGHANITTTMLYAHLAPDSLDLAREALEG